MSQPRWKREVYPENKFEYIDIEEYVDVSFLSHLRYMTVFLFTLKSVLTMMADIGIVTILIVNNVFQQALDNSCPSGAAGLNICGPQPSFMSFIQIRYRPWIILGCVCLSFILLGLDWRKANAIIKSGDISFSFTSPIAYRYYCLRSYAHYCFFRQVQNSKKVVDVLAFYCFFAFKGWKRLILAEFPRQFLNFGNIVNLIQIYSNAIAANNTVTQYDQLQIVFVAISQIITGQRQAGPAGSANPLPSSLQTVSFILSCITVGIWIVGFLSLLLAIFVYIPLYGVIQGNLKEYCCHKIDKRIHELLSKRSRKRAEESRKAGLLEIEQNHALRLKGHTTSDNGGYPGAGHSDFGGYRSDYGYRNDQAPYHQNYPLQSQSGYGQPGQDYEYYSEQSYGPRSMDSGDRHNASAHPYHNAHARAMTPLSHQGSHNPLSPVQGYVDHQNHVAGRSTGPQYANAAYDNAPPRSGTPTGRGGGQYYNQPNYR